MISAREALALPGARLNESDWKRIEYFMREVDAYVREHMNRNGVLMPVDPARMSMGIAAEMERRLRRLGWVAEFQMKREPSRIAPGQMATTYHLALRPGDEAYTEVPSA